jgi:hypothetical protein
LPESASLSALAPVFPRPAAPADRSTKSSPVHALLQSPSPITMKSKNLTKYLCLVYFEGKKFHAMSDTERAAFDRASYAYDMKLKKAGYWITAEALQSPKSARTVSKRGRKVTVASGPFVETKEALGGFILIKAKDLRHAEKIAAGIPLAGLGWVEVRPIFDFR